MTSGALNWRSLVSLVLIAGFCGTALVWVNAITAPRIETQRQEQARALMNSLLQPEQRIELKATNDPLTAIPFSQKVYDRVNRP